MIRILIALFVAAAVLAGCGSEEPDTLDAGKAEGAISEGIKQQLDVDLRVECPGNVELEKGRKFTCEGTARNSEDIPIDARQKDAAGHISWTARVMGTSRIEESISQEIRKTRNIVVTLDCPDAVQLKVDHEFECRVETPDGQRDRVIVSITDEDGSVSWEVPATPSDDAGSSDGSSGTGEVGGDASIGVSRND
jgi:hypothetical protein